MSAPSVTPAGRVWRKRLCWQAHSTTQPRIFACLNLPYPSLWFVILLARRVQASLFAGVTDFNWLLTLADFHSPDAMLLSTTGLSSSPVQAWHLCVVWSDGIYTLYPPLSCWLRPTLDSIHSVQCRFHLPLDIYLLLLLSIKQFLFSFKGTYRKTLDTSLSPPWKAHKQLSATK